MVVSKLSIFRNSEKRVVERPVSRTGIDSLTRSHHNRNFEISRRFAERIHFLAGNGDAVISELREDLFRGRVFPQCCARTHIQPRRVARQPGLSKRNEPRISLCRLLDEIESLCEARSFVQVNGSGLRDGHTHSLRLSSPLSCFLGHEGMLLRVAVYFAKPITEGSTVRPAKTAVGLGSEGCSSTPLDSAMVIARRIAASVALSSKRTLAPSDWTPSCDHKEARSTLTTGLYKNYRPNCLDLDSRVSAVRSIRSNCLAGNFRHYWSNLCTHLLNHTFRRVDLCAGITIGQ